MASLILQRLDQQAKKLALQPPEHLYSITFRFWGGSSSDSATSEGEGQRIGCRAWV